MQAVPGLAVQPAPNGSDAGLRLAQLLIVRWIAGEPVERAFKLRLLFERDHACDAPVVRVPITVYIVVYYRFAARNGPANGGRDARDIDVAKGDQLSGRIAGNAHTRALQVLHGFRVDRWMKANHRAERVDSIERLHPELNERRVSLKVALWTPTRN